MQDINKWSVWFGPGNVTLLSVPAKEKNQYRVYVSGKELSYAKKILEVIQR